MSNKLVHHLRDVNTLKTAGRNHLPLPTGPLKKVGCRDLLVGYSRKGGLLVRLFYPAAQDDEHPNTATHNPLLWSSWLSHENYRHGYVDMTGIRSNLIRQMILKLNFNKNFYIPAIQNVQPMIREQKFPVVVFSHGLGGCRTSYSTTCLELASHGFLVAAVEHRDNSACLSYFARDSAKSDPQDEVEFGSEILNPPYSPPNSLTPLTNSANLDLAWIRYRFASLTKHTPQVQQFRNNQVRYRAQECTRTLNLLETLNEGKELNNLLDPTFNKNFDLKNKLDLDRVAIMGHSFGGATSLVTGAEDSRFKVVVSLDAWAYPLKNESLEFGSKPVLLINTETMEKDAANSHKMKQIMTLKERMEPERRQSWTINKSNHMQQCDFPFVIKWLNLLSRINTFTAHDLSMALSLDFICKFLDMKTNSNLVEYLKAEKGRLRPSFTKLK